MFTMKVDQCAVTETIKDLRDGEFRIVSVIYADGKAIIMYN